MRSATLHLNRQVIRLCKGIMKAWEQWVEEVEQEELINGSKRALQSEKDKKETYRITL